MRCRSEGSLCTVSDIRLGTVKTLKLGLKFWHGFAGAGNMLNLNSTAQIERSWFERVTSQLHAAPQE